MAPGGESVWSLIFKFFNFFVLVGLLIYFVGKPLKGFLRKRHQTVKAQLEETQKTLSEAQALRVHSDAMRVRRYQTAEELGAKLPVKLMFPLILFIFPAIFVVGVGPAVIQIYHSIIAR